MICHYCKEEIADDALKCKYCGSELEDDGVELGLEKIAILLKGYIGTPSKFNIYKNAFDKLVFNGHVLFKPTWSWYAFFGGPIYFLYRRMYTIGLLLSLLLLLLLSLFGALILFITMLFSALTAKYFYIKKFIKDLNIAGYRVKDFAEVRESIKLLGGVNRGIIITLLIILLLIIVPPLLAIINARYIAGNM